jgi:signal transduction histidine kinase
MPTELQAIRSQAHTAIGALIQRDATLLAERWARRATREQPNAQRVHHQALLANLPLFLRTMGRSLAESEGTQSIRQWQLAREYGEQRWEEGWSLLEVVQDYQILRIVLVEYLEEELGRPPTAHEIMALGLFLDEAIAASVTRYATSQADYVRQVERQRSEHERQAKEALLKEQAALRLADRRKDEFVAVLAHELRNPLGPIRNVLHLLEQGIPEPATRGWILDVLNRQVEQMTRLVDDLLDVTRISRGNVLLHFERLDLVELVRAVAEDHRAGVEQAGLKLHVGLPDGPVCVRGDRVRLAQVMANLLSNACKFSDPGGRLTVELDVENRRGASSRAPREGPQDAEKVGPDKVLVPISEAIVRVTDTGIGIDTDMLPRIFEPFAQADPGVARSNSGLGIGLALVKGLVELHGGSVEAVSDGLGKGTQIAFRLPVDTAGASAVEPPAAPTARVRPQRILVIEDERDTAATMKVLLERWGHRVTVAYNGASALEAARQIPPDVVLCDIGLPGMDGFEVARALRQHPDTARARLIALTGFGTQADQQQGLQAGFDLHLTKPIEPTDLQRLLNSEKE